jgi:shikimate dehydrogenase
MSDASSKPDRYAVMGHPIDHSWSPFIHGMFARQTRQNLTYRLLDVPPDKFRAAALEFFTTGGRGLNITVPHKPAAAEFVNRLTARAETAGAVNTILVESNGELMGDNTDGVGLLTDLTANLGLRIAGLRILILGAGGATRGVLGPLLDARPAVLTIANRTPERAAELVEEFARPGTLSGCGFEEIGDEEPWDLLINATSASLKGSTPLISPTLIGAQTICYDMAYGKGDTSFTRWAREQGAVRTAKGWGMLVEQAAESFHLWRGVRPDTKSVLAALQAT